MVKETPTYGLIVVKNKATGAVERQVETPSKFAHKNALTAIRNKYDEREFSIKAGRVSCNS